MEKTKASMKKSIDKTRREMRYVQYSVLSAVFAGNLFDHYQSFSIFLSLASLDLAFRAFRKNQ